MYPRALILLAAATTVAGCANVSRSLPATLGSHSGALFSDARTVAMGLLGNEQGRPVNWTCSA